MADTGVSGSLEGKLSKFGELIKLTRKVSKLFRSVQSAFASVRLKF